MTLRKRRQEIIDSFDEAGRGPCPWGCELAIVKRPNDSDLGFCPMCKGRARWTGSGWERSEEPIKILGEVESEFWKIIREAHCSHPQNKKGGHRCVGVVSFTPRGQELDCSLCGHTRQRPRDEELHPERFEV